MNRLLASLGLTLLLMLALSVTGCKGDSAQEAREHADTGYADIVLKLNPDPPLALKDVELIAEVRDGAGAPLRDAEVVFDLSMPGMYHGENRPVAIESAPGIYEAAAIFSMGGRWLVAVGVKAPGIDVQRKFYTTAEGG